MANRVEVGVLTANSRAYTGGGSQYMVQTPAGALYCFAIEAANDVYYRKSTDGGITWGVPVAVFAGTAVQLAVWYDEWSGVAGGKIRMAYAESGGSDVLYRDLDVDTDTLGTQTTIFAGASVAGTQCALSIVTTRGGNLICVYNIDAGAEDGAAESNDGGATWTGTIADPTEAAVDMWILAPGWNADTQDAMLFFWDVSADEISVKRYDDSANTWTETSISAGMVENAQSSAYPHFAVAVDYANNRNVIIAWNGVDAANADLKCWAVDDTTITAKTDVVTNVTDDCGLAAIAVDAHTGYWYAFWCGKADGSETWPTSINVYYAVSTDAGTSWSSPAKLSETALETRMLFTSAQSYGFPFVKRQTAGYGLNVGDNGGVQSIFAPLRGPRAQHQLVG